MGRLPLVAWLAAALSLAPAASAAAEPGPALRAPEAELLAGLDCPSELRAGRGEPVLLVHGSGGSGEAVWSWNWMRVVPHLGLSVCTIDLPTKATGDMQRTVEALVAAIRHIRRVSGGKVDVVGHSQGGNQARWATKWWPDVRQAVDDLVMLATPNHGTASGAAFCPAVGQCPAIMWQLATGSAYIGAQNRGEQTPGPIDYSSIYTETDELNHPADTARLAGAVNVSVQSVCPGRFVHHFALVYDAVATALALDALEHPGPVAPGRVAATVCHRFAMDGLDPAATVAADARWYADGFMAIWEAERYPAEPPLEPYAREGTSR